jgi:hypothetical protein
MPSENYCPLKFGNAVNHEGMIIEIPCVGKDCAWFFDTGCSVKIIAKELGANHKKKLQKGLAAD